jgi:rubrerythrin
MASEERDTMQTIEQTIRNAIETERAAARFYNGLLPKAADERAREFFAKMVKDEEAHAEAIERMGRRLGAQELPERPDHNIALVESCPGWSEAESIDLAQALTLAIEAENHAALFYDAVADSVSGELATFFKDLTEMELGHARRLSALLEELSDA